MKRMIYIPAICFIVLTKQLSGQGTASHPLKPIEQSIQLSSGVKLEYAEQGNTNGIPVILLHGFTDSWHSYETVLPFLPANIHAFAVSQRGHGNSSKPVKGYHPKDFAADIAAFIKEKKLGTVFIAGHSMGGVITQQFALNHPQLVKGIVLVSTDAAFRENPGLSEFKEEVLKLTDPVSYRFADEFQKSTIVRPVDSVYINTLVGESLKVPAWVWKATMNEFFNVDYSKELNKISKPALIVWGDKDVICSKADQDILLTGIRNAKMLVYEGTGHALHWEQPERFAGDLVDFISRIEPVK
jgi:pimeloyl-ACP methyl ester carboxylesterase